MITLWLQNKGKRMATMSSLDGLLKFGNLSHLDDDATAAVSGDVTVKLKKPEKRLGGGGGAGGRGGPPRGGSS